MHVCEGAIVSRIDVNLNHVTRFYEDSNTMLKASLGLTRAEQSITALMKKTEQGKHEMQRALESVKARKVSVSACITSLKVKIAWLQTEIHAKEFQLEQLNALLAFVTGSERAALKAEIVALKTEIRKLKSELHECQSMCSSLESMKERLNSEQAKLENIISKLENAKSELESTSQELNETKESSVDDCERAQELLQEIINVIKEYNSQTISQGSVVSVQVQMKTSVHSQYPTKVFYSVDNIEEFKPRDIQDDLTLEEREEIIYNQKAFEGSSLYLSHMGVDLKALENAKTYEEKVQILKDCGQDENQANQILSIYEGNFLSDIDGSQNAFYKTSPQTAGDSYEFQRFFVNLRDGKETAKEVPFDLTQYKDRPCTFLGYNEKIENSSRKTDVVRFEGNKEIHEELKVGRVYGLERKAKFRQELYGDDLRLRLYPNQEQEYRIRKNSTNQKCLFDDKEQTKYLCTMLKRHPKRVRVYYNDKLLTLKELENMSR